jgi:hypothetical protein
VTADEESGLSFPDMTDMGKKGHLRSFGDKQLSIGKGTSRQLTIATTKPVS